MRKMLIEKDEILQMFRDGVNMYNNKANLSQISNNIYACKEYTMITGYCDEVLPIEPPSALNDYRCSECKRYTIGYHKPGFCSHCGAKLSDKNEEEN